METAIAVFGLLLVLVFGTAAVTAVIGQLRCTDAAREAARVIARGESDRAEAVLRSVAPAGARLTVQVDGDTVRVEVAAEPAGGVLPGVHLRAKAFAVLEPGVGDG